MIRIILIGLAVLFVLLAKKGKGYWKVVITSFLVITVIAGTAYLPKLTSYLKEKKLEIPKEGIITGSEERMSDSERAYRDGLRALDRKEYVTAISYFEMVNPQDKFYSDAMAKYQQIVPEVQRQLLTDAKAKIKAGEMEDAQTLLDKLLSYGSNKEAEVLKKQVDSKVSANNNKQFHLPSPEERTRIKKHVGQWDFGFGQVGIAVKEVKMTSVVNTQYNFDYEIGDGQGRFLWLKISAYNDGTSEAKVNTDDFYISTPDGTRIVRHESTFSQKYFTDTKLGPKKSAEGYIIFLVPQGKEYTLHYYGPGGGVDKEIKL